MVCGFEPRPVQSVQNYQTEKHVYENEHDGRYTCDEIQCQNIDNQDERNCSQKTHMEKNELVLLFPMKKRMFYLKRSTISNKYMWRRIRI
jgi:hypothetical protein